MMDDVHNGVYQRGQRSIFANFTSWKAACVQAIRTEVSRYGWTIEEVHKSSTGSWYVRVAPLIGPGRKACIRLSDHRSAAFIGNRRLLFVHWKRPGKMRQLRSWLADMVYTA